MQKGYIRKQEARARELATLMASIYNTIPKQRGGKFYTVDDFIKGQNDAAEVSVEDRRKLALEALENSKRFDRGVTYTKNF